MPTRETIGLGSSCKNNVKGCGQLRPLSYSNLSTPAYLWAHMVMCSEPAASSSKTKHFSGNMIPHDKDSQMRISQSGAGRGCPVIQLCFSKSLDVARSSGSHCRHACTPNSNLTSAGCNSLSVSLSLSQLLSLISMLQQVANPSDKFTFDRGTLFIIHASSFTLFSLNTVVPGMRHWESVRVYSRTHAI